MSSAPASLRVHSLETLGTQDGPGIRLVVFVQGCLMRCAYCHNPDTLALDGGRLMTIDELVGRALRQKRYFGETGGVTVSGGEPTLQRVAVRELFAALRAEGIHTCLDTNGHIFDEDTQALYEATDLVLLDVKHIDPVRHRDLTGVSNDNVLRCAVWREQTGRPLWLRYVLVPGWTDQPEALEAWARHFAAYRTVQRVEILPYHKLGVHKWAHLGMQYRLEGVEPPTLADCERAREVFSAHLTNVSIK